MVLPPTGSPKLPRVVAVAIFVQRSLRFSLPGWLSFDCNCACAATRHRGFGAVPQSDCDWHSPPTSCLPDAQLEHWLASGPVQVAHDGSHAEQTASLVAVQTALTKKPALQVMQVSQEV